MSKISRICIKLPNDINIFTIVKSYLLKKISDKLYIYIDDSIYDSDIDDNIFKLITMMNNFGIYVDCIIRYSDYYNISRIYIHRLIKSANIKIITDFSNPKKDIYLNDYNLLSTNYYNLKILLISNTYPDFNYIIFDKGTYDELFLITVIDDSEKISYLPIDNKNNNITDKIKNILSTNLHFKYPEPVLFDITTLINNYINIHSNTHSNKSNLSILDLLMNQLYKLNVDNIIDIIKNHELINNYAVNITTSIDNINSNTVYVIENPINIMLSNNKIISIHNTIINLTNKLYIENTSNYDFTHEGSKFNLKYAGNIYIKYLDNNLYGTFRGIIKKKKKISTKWIPNIKPINQTCYKIEDSKTIIAIYSNFDITTKQFIHINNKIYLFDFNTNHNEYSSLILLK